MCQLPSTLPVARSLTGCPNASSQVMPVTGAHAPARGSRPAGQTSAEVSRGVLRMWWKGSAMGKLRYHHYHRWGPARRPVTPLLVVLCTVLVASVGLVAVTLLTMLLTLGPLLLAGLG